MTILIIALAGVVPILLCRLYTDSKKALVVVAILSALVGALTGNPIFIALDVAVVALGAYFFWPDPSGEPKATAPQSKQPRTIQPTQTGSGQINANVPGTAPLEAARWIELDPSKTGRKYSSLVTSLVVLVSAWVVLLYFKGPYSANGRTDTQPAQSIPTAIAAPAVSPSIPSLSPNTARPVPNSMSGLAKGTSNSKVVPTVDQCLKIPSDQKMQRCLEGLK